MTGLYDKLQLKHSLCLKRNNICFVIGGTKDLIFPLFKSYQEICKDESFLKIAKDICSYFIIFSDQIDPLADKQVTKLLEQSYGQILKADHQNIKVIIISSRKQPIPKDSTISSKIRFITLAADEDISLHATGLTTGKKHGGSK